MTIEQLQQGSGTGAVTTAGINYDNNGLNKSLITLDGEDGTTIKNLKNGAVNSSSTEAVTGQQLNTNYQNMAESLGGGAKYENEEWTAPTYTVGSGNNQQTYNDVGSAIHGLNDQINNFDNKFNDLSKDMKASTAAAIAIASLPQPIEKGASMLAVGSGVWENEGGFSIGASGITEDKKLFNTPVNYVWKMATTTNTRSKWGGGASVGVQWK